MSKFNYDDVTDYSLEPELLEEILQKQIECTFIWGPKDHWAVGVLMTMTRRRRTGSTPLVRR